MRQSSNRTFGLVMTVFFAVVALLPLWRSGPIRLWALVVSAVFLLAALLAPAILTPLNRLWTMIGLVLHKVTNPLILGLLFFGLLTPFGWVRRRMGRDSLRLQKTPGSGSYWIERTPPGPTPDSIVNQY